MKIRRNYPLTSVEEIVYPVNNDKQEFQLIFASYIMTLRYMYLRFDCFVCMFVVLLLLLFRSDSESDAEDWVQMITNGQLLHENQHVHVHVCV